MLVLAGDIGGTHARLAVVEIDSGALRLVDAEDYPSREFAGLAEVVAAFRRDGRASGVDRACFAVAGPVTDGRVVTPNLPWALDADSLVAATRIARVALVNDFLAVGHGLARLGAADVETLQAGDPEERGAIALVGPGTGLGVAFLHWGGAAYDVHPSEGGHISFAPSTPLLDGLLAYLRSEFGHVSFERVVSGPGLVNVYRYLAATGYAPEGEDVRAEMGRDDDAAVITRYGVAGTDLLSRAALDLFVTALGGHAGDMALAGLATGGVYVAGGIAPRIIERLRGGAFLDAFRAKGRMSHVVAKVPVHVIRNPRVGLYGAAVVASRL